MKTTKEILESDEKLHTHLKEHLLRGRVEKLMERYAQERVTNALKEAAEEIKKYVRSLDAPENDVYKDNELLIRSCFAKSIKILEQISKDTNK